MEPGLRIIAAVLISGALSQVIKCIFHSWKYRKLLWQPLFVTGMMPSSHAAVTSALLTGVLLEEGWASVTAIAVVIWLIVIVDAIGVRRSVGEEGHAINEIIRHERFRIKRMHIAEGHYPLEVLAGICLGVLVSIIVWA